MKNHKTTSQPWRPPPEASKHWEPLCLAFARVLHEERLRLGFSRQELARRADTSRQAIAFIETWQRQPTLNLLARLARGCGRRATRLLARAEALARIF